ncbi:hypothetical protein O3M35_008459 [Rhynocoris fuscipes]|uniref:Protein LTV1 homolog n=1 Tax=Rhynocoris fuscipes TaxID=488301 RepID=A0AAW1D6A5_9HEMI
MGKKKKFIDKKNSITFRLVHRSQRDPLITDETAPKHVLQEIKKERKDELEKFGIYYEDDYDYMQHLKERTNVAEMVEIPSIVTKEKKQANSISLPSSVFPSKYEEKVGLLNKAAPRSGLQLDLDPDIIDVVAAMDEDFDFSDPENMLEDDFVLKAIGTPGSIEEEEEDESDKDEMEGDSDEDRFSYEDTKSRFTEYSMTSSVIRRNEQLTMLDGRFEEMFSQYDDNEIGSLDCEEIEGDIDNKNEMLEKIIKQYENTHLTEPLKTEPTVIPDLSDSSSSDSENSVVEVKEKEKWDCESILSTYSTIYNHPKLINAPPSDRIKISNKTGIPIIKERLTASTLAKLNEDDTEVTKNRATGPGSLASAVSYLSIRPKGETPKDRLARKRAFKNHKRERRAERKINTEAFKEEKKRMEKMRAHNNVTKFQVPI